MYIFKNNNPQYWDGIISLKRKYRSQLIWELAADPAKPELQEQVHKIAKKIEVLFLNSAEAMCLFQRARKKPLRYCAFRRFLATD